ncbi:MAG TPA: DciA family protein [Azospirillaceae bacterium]|nr:DciA family protein [Azospirillaceae bacterium]
MSGPRTLAAIVPTLASGAMKRRGLAFGPLLADWASVVGPHLADHAVPFKLVFPPGRRDGAVLHLRVTGAAALELQHSEAQVLERVNAFFGYAAVVRLKLVQGPPGSRRGAIQRRARPIGAPDAVRLSGLEQCLNSVTDPELKETLSSLARAMTSRGKG